MNKKKLRNILLPIVIIAVIVACYVGYFMRTQPLLDCMTGTDIPSTGEITRYDEAHKDGVSLAVTSPDQVSGLWQAIQDTEVRFVRGRGTAVAPPGGVYYEVSPDQCGRRLGLWFRLQLQRGPCHPGLGLRHCGREPDSPGFGRPLPRFGGVTRRAAKNLEMPRKFSKIQLIFAGTASIMLR